MATSQTPLTLTANDLSQRSGEMSKMDANWRSPQIPALFTRMSMPP